ncbi:hypothetical protein [Flavihumibacter petaseus]|uniref:Glycosyltransferase RgtA/B/C/D-like domain-containing protein n=1 Tax=Flavihumibacter petaseus NBRC 106054 TaxID=1220578 RepID=A0A0E9N0S3_9BACT|nr:hypothetical protein [Flavihumibacter petaseus]GAO43612.1 hypothetical protein FPE01S_02_07180 [Flavihumibacter petaseus NBRC 106054]
MPGLLRNYYLLCILAAMVVLRLPSLNRPVSKHHEFNTAVVLINAESWKQAGGGSQFSFTPLMNYQGDANKKFEEGPYIDAAHNHVYLSFGAGWYVLPYAIFTLLKLPFTPIWLQLLNIAISLFTIAMLYLLIRETVGNKPVALVSCTLFGLLPAILWYGGNGYVNTSIMLPMVIAFFYTWFQMEKGPANVGYISLSALFFIGIILCYFDWLGVFLLGFLAVWSLFRLRIDKRYGLVLSVSILALLCGIMIPLAQFAHYLGWHQVLQYWQSRFVERSAGDIPLTGMVSMVAKNLVSGYPVLLLLLPAALLAIVKNGVVTTWPIWALSAVLFYNLVFFNWSAVHEFAWLGFALAATVLVATYLLPRLGRLQLRWLLFLCIPVSAAIYFFINRPGAFSWKGESYNAEMTAGAWIKKHIPSDVAIFSDVQISPAVSYYSKRSFTSGLSMEAAKETMIRYNLTDAVWLNTAEEPWKAVFLHR